MKGLRRYKILEAVANGKEALSDLFVVFAAPYGSSMRGIQYRQDKRRRERAKTYNKYRDRRAFAELLYRLRRDQLVIAHGDSKQRRLILTKKGRAYLTTLGGRTNHVLPEVTYAAEDDGLVKIIMFDIPEQERTKRSWLRAALGRLRFRMLQKSVWIGRTKIPEGFLLDLRRLKIISHVEIIAVTKTGSLKRILED